MLIVVMGVSGSGKSTIGELLADQFSFPFLEGDDFHPQANVEKMSSGIPLNDDDREPWLVALSKAAGAEVDSEGGCVVACSALKASYRESFLLHVDQVFFVQLNADPALIRARMDEREGHFMSSAMLDSQLATLEPLEEGPQNIIVDNAGLSPEEILEKILVKIDVDGS